MALKKSKFGDGDNDDLTGVCFWAGNNNRDRESTMLCIIVWPFILNFEKIKKKTRKNTKKILNQ